MSGDYAKLRESPFWIYFLLRTLMRLIYCPRAKRAAEKTKYFKSEEWEILGAEDEFLALVERNRLKPAILVWLSSISRKRGFIGISHYAASLALNPSVSDLERDDPGAIACLFVAVKEEEIDLETVSGFLSQVLNLNGIAVADLYDLFVDSIDRG